MKQSRVGSFYEALTTNFQVAGYFTVISIISSYVIRRWLNGRIHGAAHRMAGGCDARGS